MKNKLIVLSVLGASIIAFALGTYFYKKTQQENQLKTLSKGEVSLVREHSPSIGSPMARIKLVEFLDPECESCRYFHPIVKNILEKYEGKIYYVVRYAPFHTYSKEAIAFLEASRKQGKYWETLDLLFQKQPEWADHHNPRPELKWTYLSELDLEEEQMRVDINSSDIKKIIDMDTKDGEKLKIKGTPTFFINGKELEEFGVEQLIRAIDQAAK